MLTPTTERRLIAVIKADIVGYTKLMKQHEDATIQAWWACRNDIIDPAIEAFGGTIVKHTGDGFLAEFPSVLDAMNCAIEMQTALERRNREVAEQSRIEFRMGLNLCDVLSDEEDIYGDGVNITARIEALAQPGGICVTAAVYQQVKGKVAADFEDMVAVNLKNVVEPLQVFHALPPTRSIAAAPEATPAPESVDLYGDALSERMSIISAAVIFFVILIGVVIYAIK